MQDNNSSFSSLFRLISSKTTSQKWLYILYAFLLIPQVLPLMRALELRVGLSFFAPISDGVFITIAVLGCIGLIWKSIRINNLLFILLVIVYYYASAAMFPRTATLSQENAIFFILSCLPMSLVGLTINRDISREIFVILAYVALVLQILFLAFFGMGINEEGAEVNEMMSAAYSFLPFVLFLMWYAFEYGNFFNYMMFSVGVFILMALGARGPIICMLTFIVLYFLFYKTYKHNWLVKSIIVIVGLIIISYVNEIALFLTPFADSLGLSTRVFDSIIEEQMVNIQQSNGRDDIWSYIISYLISHKAYFGEGLYSDRIINGNGLYAHNLELELLCSFGLVGGVIVFVILCYIIYRAFIKSRGTQASIVLLVFFCSSILQLQFSGTFLRSQVFWFFVGMCVAVQRKDRHKSIKSY